VSIPDKIKSGDSSVVIVVLDSKSHVIAVKTSKSPGHAKLIHREAAILQSLKHRSVLNCMATLQERPTTMDPLNAQVIAAFAWRSAAFARCQSDRGNCFCDAIRALPLDWDLIVRIAELGRSASLKFNGNAARSAPIRFELLIGRQRFRENLRPH
jgi:hypothetical protein